MLNADDLAGLRYLRLRLEAALLGSTAPWSRKQIAECIAAIDGVLRSGQPLPVEVSRVRARAKSLLATARGA